jgi:hypothetical protein
MRRGTVEEGEEDFWFADLSVPGPVSLVAIALARMGRTTAIGVE